VEETNIHKSLPLSLFSTYGHIFVCMAKLIHILNHVLLVMTRVGSCLVCYFYLLYFMMYTHTHLWMFIIFHSDRKRADSQLSSYFISRFLYILISNLCQTHIWHACLKCLFFFDSHQKILRNKKYHSRLMRMNESETIYTKQIVIVQYIKCHSIQLQHMPTPPPQFFASTHLFLVSNLM
jgi:hypothetical protein